MKKRPITIRRTDRALRNDYVYVFTHLGLGTELSELLSTINPHPDTSRLIEFFY